MDYQKVIKSGCNTSIVMINFIIDKWFNDMVIAR